MLFFFSLLYSMGGTRMAKWKELERQICVLAADESQRPVAITFLDSEPEGIAKFSGTEPAGCSFWRLAAAGRTFYTVPADHFNCAVGAYTHNIQLPPERREGNGNDAGDDVRSRLRASRRNSQHPTITERAGLQSSLRRLGTRLSFPASSFSPAETTSAMLLNEASHPRRRERCFAGTRTAKLHGASGSSAAWRPFSSLGCIGNRVYTGSRSGRTLRRRASRET